MLYRFTGWRVNLSAPVYGANFASSYVQPCKPQHRLAYQAATIRRFLFNNINLRRQLRGPNWIRLFNTSAASFSNRFTYGISASYSAKGHRFNPETNLFNFNPFHRIQSGVNERSPQKKQQRPASGQDAFFISRIGDTGEVAFGVADGVGGWVESGVDPADFSHGFCDHMATYTYEFKSDSSRLGPRDVMQAGYERLVKDKSVFAGGSTACIGIARSDGTLDVANLGDSGFIHLRLNAVHYASEPQTHAFNTPYQLSLIPKHILRQSAVFGGAPLCDMPKDSNISNHTLKHGDVLIFASDGVWDNLTSQEILRMVSKYMTTVRAWQKDERGLIVGGGLEKFIQREGLGLPEELTLPGLLAVAVTAQAKLASMNTKVDGPFAREVHRYFPLEDYHGGKMDDICVVVVVAVETTA